MPATLNEELLQFTIDPSDIIESIQRAREDNLREDAENIGFSQEEYEYLGVDPNDLDDFWRQPEPTRIPLWTSEEADLFRRFEKRDRVVTTTKKPTTTTTKEPTTKKPTTRTTPSTTTTTPATTTTSWYDS